MMNRALLWRVLPAAVLIALISGVLLSGPNQAQSPLSATVQVDASRQIRQIPATLFGSNLEWVWNENALWNTTSGAIDSRYQPMLKTLAPPLLRFPGGLFADFYDWHNGMGPVARRPVTTATPGGITSTNDFGTNEALTVARAAGGQLLITVNVGTGTPQMAADWVRYCNKTSAGPRVDYWELGNELYIPQSQIGSVSVATMSASQYSNAFVQFAQAMKAVDPTIKVGAILDESFTRNPPSDWTRAVLPRVGLFADFVAVHNAYAPVLAYGSTQSVETIYGAMLAVPQLLKQNLNRLATQIDTLVPERKGQIDIAVTEWGPFFASDLHSPYLDHPKTLGSSLYTASALMSLISEPRTEIANFFKFNDVLYMGAIGVDARGNPQPTASYYALQLMSRTAGSFLIGSTVTSPTYNSAAAGIVPATSNVPYLDAISTLSPDGRLVRVIAVNKHFTAPIRLQVNLGTLTPSSDATVLTLSGTAIDANTGTVLPQVNGVYWPQQSVATNSRFYAGGPQEVRVTTSTVTTIGNSTYLLPAASVTVIEIPIIPTPRPPMAQPKQFTQ